MKFLKYSGSVINVKELRKIELNNDSVIIYFYETPFWYLELENNQRLSPFFYLIVKCLSDKECLICDLDDLKRDKNYLF